MKISKKTWVRIGIGTAVVGGVWFVFLQPATAPATSSSGPTSSPSQPHHAGHKKRG